MRFALSLPTFLSIYFRPVDPGGGASELPPAARRQSNGNGDYRKGCCAVARLATSSRIAQHGRDYTNTHPLISKASQQDTAVYLQALVCTAVAVGLSSSGSSEDDLSSRKIDTLR